MAPSVFEKSSISSLHALGLGDPESQATTYAISGIKGALNHRRWQGGMQRTYTIAFKFNSSTLILVPYFCTRMAEILSTALVFGKDLA